MPIRSNAKNQNKEIRKYNQLNGLGYLYAYLKKFMLT